MNDEDFDDLGYSNLSMGAPVEVKYKTVQEATPSTKYKLDPFASTPKTKIYTEKGTYVEATTDGLTINYADQARKAIVGVGITETTSAGGFEEELTLAQDENAEIKDTGIKVKVGGVEINPITKTVDVNVEVSKLPERDPTKLVVRDIELPGGVKHIIVIGSHFVNKIADAIPESQNIKQSGDKVAIRKTITYKGKEYDAIFLAGYTADDTLDVVRKFVEKMLEQ